jgi:hypothetical protein
MNYKTLSRASVESKLHLDGTHHVQEHFGRNRFAARIYRGTSLLADLAHFLEKRLCRLCDKLLRHFLQLRIQPFANKVRHIGRQHLEFCAYLFESFLNRPTTLLSVLHRLSFMLLEPPYF